MCGIVDIYFNEIETIRELWEKNRKYHEEGSEHFKELYRTICFDERIKAFGVMNQENVKISVAKEKDGIVGYCISTAVNGKGELESLHVAAAHRGSGIGKALVLKHTEWMQEQNCKVIGVTVSQENEATIDFYKKLGFYPNTLYMQQK